MMTQKAGLQEPAELEFTAAGEGEETLLGDTLRNTPAKTEDVRLMTEEEDGEETLEQTVGQDTAPPVLQSSCTKSTWVEGAACEAVCSEDGRLYPAKVVSVDGERCRVRFYDDGNEEEVELCALKSPDSNLQAVERSQEWKPGSLCRAAYSGDGLVYPAVVLWVRGQRCRIRFDGYNNEEEHDVSSLLGRGELRGNSPATKTKGSNWKSKVTSVASDWKRSREEERGRERRSAWREEQQDSSTFNDNPSKVDKDSEERKRRSAAQQPSNQGFPFFPQFPPPQMNSGDYVPFIPPPPPLWASGEKKPDGVAATYNLLMLWYLCGFNTGFYMAQQGFQFISKP